MRFKRPAAPRPAPLASWWLGEPSCLRTLAHAVTCLGPLACELHPQQHVRTRVFPRVTPLPPPHPSTTSSPGPVSSCWSLDTPNHARVPALSTVPPGAAGTRRWMETLGAVKTSYSEVQAGNGFFSWSPARKPFLPIGSLRHRVGGVSDRGPQGWEPAAAHHPQSPTFRLWQGLGADTSHSQYVTSSLLHVWPKPATSGS